MTTYSWLRARLRVTAVPLEKRMYVHRILSLVPLLIYAVACSDAPTRVMMPVSSPSLATGVIADSELTYTNLEALFLEMDRAVPGFGGLFREGAQLVAVTKASDRSSTEAQLRRVLRLPRYANSELRGLSIDRVDAAAFSFTELARWRRALRTDVLDTKGVSSFDLDERANRLVIGVASDVDALALRRLFANAGVPAVAILLRAEELSSGAQGASLDSRVRPLTAGTRFGRYYSTVQPPNYSMDWVAVNWCTMGVSAMRQGIEVLLLVSHCTHREGALDTDPANWTNYYIGQDWYPAIDTASGWFTPPAPFGYNPFGQELFDRAGDTCGPLFDRRPCRHAEVAAWSVGGIEVALGETAFTLGRIARPAFAVPGTNPSGFTRSLDALQPFFTITGEHVNPMAGELVQKVGLTTGWTYGTVYQTCVDINYQTAGSSVKRRVWCYDRADLGVQPGDSGSPVFRILDHAAGTVLFYGLVSFKGTDQLGSTGFGSVRQLRGELGAFQVF